MEDTRYLDGFIGELLHINEVAENKLVDLNADNKSGVYYLSHACADFSAYAVNCALTRRGKTGNTVLTGSALTGEGQTVSNRVNTFSFKDAFGNRDAGALRAFVSGARKDLYARGNNTLFMSVGALKWSVPVRELGKEKPREVLTPFLVFPVRLISPGPSSPVTMEFVEDEVYVNPCLIAKLKEVLGEEAAKGVPACGEDIGEPVDIGRLSDGEEYFAKVKEYFGGFVSGEEGASPLDFDKDIVAIARYKHDELCTYYDIRRNRQRIYSHPLVERLFCGGERPASPEWEGVLPPTVLPTDSVQQRIISRICAGESLIIKGPPGTGKTATIANVLAALMAQNKKVIFASKKLSALGEAYAKLPPELRKFALLLDSETESGAAAINTDEVKKDFKNLLAEARDYQRPKNLATDIALAEKERAEALRSVSAYIDLTFNGEVAAGESFYSVLDTCCKCNAPIIDLGDDVKAAGTPREKYAGALERAAQAEKYFGVLSGDGEHPVFKCPWFGLDPACDTEGAYSAMAEIARHASSLIAEAESVIKNAGEFTLSGLYYAAGCGLSAQQLEELFAGGRLQGVAESLSAELQRLRSLPACDGDIKLTLQGGERAEALALKLGASGADGKLTFAEIELICRNEQTFTGLSDAALNDAASAIESCESAEKAYASLICGIAQAFGADDENSISERMRPLARALESYFGKSPAKPQLFDFKARKAFSEMNKLGGTRLTFAEAVEQAEKLKRADGLRAEADLRRRKLNAIFGMELTEDNVAAVRLLTEKDFSAHGLHEYIDKVVKIYPVAAECFACAAGADGLTLEGLARLMERESVKERISAVIAELSCEGLSGRGREEELAATVVALSGFYNTCQAVGADGKAAAGYAAALSKGCAAEKAAKVTALLEGFGGKYFRNYYVINGEDNSVADLKIFVSEAEDRDKLAAAARYGAIKNCADGELDLSGFLYWFEKGGRLEGGLSFKDAFEHSFFALAAREVNSALGISRNGMGDRLESDLNAVAAADEKLCGLNALAAEGKCLARINSDDGDFAFVQDRNPAENLRLTFKRHGGAILKLKKCFMLSPYTASLLFGGDEFSDFDVLVLDEASQLEPALILPVLFRSKQCVIVGDEWQMPPIKHFVSLSSSREWDEEGYASLEPEISVLGLALRGGGFPVEELVCHYRSKTEALFGYSQRAFYPSVRTFPSPVCLRAAAKGVPALGFNDVLVQGGTVVVGTNEKEAEKVIEVLKRHFEYYYDEKTRTLSLPVGIVAFGEAQRALIESKLHGDKALYAKVTAALESFKDMPEKLIFLKTIETVQGQETGHLILSLTHGRRESGLNMNFGQLNRGKLGKCIFNVAVTRAQYMITVVHSVRAEEIYGESVGYIKEYLETVERYCNSDTGGFLRGEEKAGFISSVADFIRASGIDGERVVVGYGATDGSVRIPIAVLSEDKKKALLGVWCESPAGRYDYLDYNMRYYRTLVACGWKLHRVNIHDWTDNPQGEKAALLRALENITDKQINEEKL